MYIFRPLLTKSLGASGWNSFIFSTRPKKEWNKSKESQKNKLKTKIVNKKWHDLKLFIWLKCRLALLQHNWLECCTRIAEVQVQIVMSLNFFRHSFRICLNCMLFFNCDDFLYISRFIRLGFFIKRRRFIHIMICTVLYLLTKWKLQPWLGLL